MPNARLQTVYFSGGPTTTSQSISFSAITSGNDILIAVNVQGATVSGLPSDCDAVDLSVNSVFSETWKFYRVRNVTDGRTTFNFTTSTAIQISGFMREVSGLDHSASGVDVILVDSSSSGASCQATGTTTTSGGYAFAVLTESSGGTNTVNGGPPTQTLQTGDVNFVYAVDALDTGAPGSKTVGASMTAGSMVAFGVVYKTATAGPLLEDTLHRPSMMAILAQ